jgi:para-nitrobenzyl esterase
MITDQLLTEPARFLAASHARSSHARSSHARSGQPVYRYLFGYVPEAERGSVPGATHASELLFVFNNLAAYEDSVLKYTDADKATAAAMSRYWTNFARNGDPNGTGLASWPPDGDDRILVFDATGQHAEHALKQPQLDRLARLATAH